jgi:hypothetical protein
MRSNDTWKSEKSLGAAFETDFEAALEVDLGVVFFMYG